jgi:hypothetical protein
MLQITNDQTGVKIEVAANDLPETLYWNKAVAACEAMGSGWRLPTLHELELIYEQIRCEGLSEFQKEAYWTSTEFEDEDEGEMAKMIDFYDGMELDNPKDMTKGYVRAVKSI